MKAKKTKTKKEETSYSRGQYEEDYPSHEVDMQAWYEYFV